MAKIVFLGGGKREEILKEAVSERFESVLKIESKEEFSKHLEDIVECEILIAPISNTDQNGLIKESKDLSLLDVLDVIKSGTYLLIGVAKDNIKVKAKRAEVEIIELGNYDALAWLNAIPTAEGTIQQIMSNTDTTIDGSAFLIIGAGRVALTLGQRLKALGGEVTIAARKQDQIARSIALGIYATQIESVKGTFEAVVNTVPAPILTKEFFRQNRTTLYVELASDSGLLDPLPTKISHLALPGLPGKYAPKKAGTYLASSIPPLIAKLLK